jgi:hypothetical protein
MQYRQGHWHRPPLRSRNAPWMLICFFVRLLPMDALCWCFVFSLCHNIIKIGPDQSRFTLSAQLLKILSTYYLLELNDSAMNYRWCCRRQLYGPQNSYLWVICIICPRTWMQELPQRWTVRETFNVNGFQVRPTLRIESWKQLSPSCIGLSNTTAVPFEIARRYLSEWAPLAFWGNGK